MSIGLKRTATFDLLHIFRILAEFLILSSSTSSVDRAAEQAEMIVFKFMELPEEIRILVVQRAIPRLHNHRDDGYEERKRELLSYSIIPEFRFEAQRELFHSPWIFSNTQLNRFIDCIEIGGGRLAKGVKKLSIQSCDFEEESMRLRLDNLFDQLLLVTHLELCAVASFPFSSIARIPNLIHLECCMVDFLSSTVVPGASPIIFRNIESFLCVCQPLENIQSFLNPTSFPSLITLDLHGNSFAPLELLLPQIINLVVLGRELSSYPKKEILKSLRNIQFSQSSRELIVDVLSKLDVELESIRFVDVFSGGGDSRRWIEVIEGGKIDSIAKLKSFTVSQSEEMDWKELRIVLERKKIKFYTSSPETSFFDYLNDLKKEERLESI